jgi:hypothetical protein
MNRTLKGLKRTEIVEGKRVSLVRMRVGMLRAAFKVQKLLFSPKLLTGTIFYVHPPERGAGLLQELN